MTKKMVRTRAGAARAHAAALRSLNAALSSLRRFPVQAQGVGLVELALVMLDGTVGRALEGEDAGFDDGRMAESPLRDDPNDWESFGPNQLDARARWLASEAHASLARTAEREAEKATAEKADRLAVALRDDPDGARFDRLDAEQERHELRSARRAS
jgi:hypothetical protein